MKPRSSQQRRKTSWLLLMLLVITVIAVAGSASATCYQTQAEADAAGASTVRIHGSIFTGAMDPVTGAPITTHPAGGIITNASVMVQNMHHGGPLECYALVTGNTYEAYVPVGGEYVVEFSAPNHDVTSREFSLKTTAPGTVLPAVDAFIPPMVTDPATGLSALPLGNALLYAFSDNYVNSEDDWPIDTGLAGVTFYIFDEDGNFEKSGVSGMSPTLPPLAGPDPAGLYYFTGLKPGEHKVMALPPGVSPDTDIVTGKPILNCGFDPAATGWIWNSTEEGTQCWDIVVRPDDPGTAPIACGVAGGYLAWFSFIPMLPPLPPFVPVNPGDVNNLSTIIVNLWDADGTDPIELINPHEVPQICQYDYQGSPAHIPPDFNTGYHPQNGTKDTTHPQSEDCVWPNIHMDHGYAVLWDQGAVNPHPIATATDITPTDTNGDGVLQFDNVPPGNYKIFVADGPLDYIWQETQVTAQPGLPVQTVNIFMPRWYARINGYVVNDSTGTKLNDVKVDLRLTDGSVWKTQTTAPGSSGFDLYGEPVQPGYFNFDENAEVEVMAHLNVDYHTLPINLRGVQDPLSVCYPDPVTALPICGNFDLSNRDIGWFTANYRTILHVENIPATEGYIIGSVYHDHQSYDSVTATWHPDGAFNEGEDPLFPGVTVNLLNPSVIDPATGLGTVVATTTTGVFEEDRAVAQGHIRPYTAKGYILGPEIGYNIGDIEVDEWGGIFKGPRLGQYEFRGVAPGTYQVQVVMPAGYEASPALTEVQTITVTGGQRNNVDFGLASIQPVPRAGEIEGGVFDDVFIDNNHQSILWLEKQGLPHVGVGIYDHLGYKLGQGYMGHPWCTIPQPPNDPASGALNGNICPSSEPLGQKPEIERRSAPGVHIFLANDATLPGHTTQYCPLPVNYTFGPGKFKFEADWSLLPTSFLEGPGGGVLLPVAAPILVGGVPLVKNYGPSYEGRVEYAVYKGDKGLDLQFVGDHKKKDEHKHKKHSKHKMKEKEGYKGGKHHDKDHNNKDDNDEELQGHHDENNGQGGDAVSSIPYILNGTNFGSAQGHSTVSLSGQELPVTSWSDTQIVVQIPSTAISGPMIVATTNGISNSIDVVVSPATPEWAAYLAARTVYVDATAMVGAGDGSQVTPFATITEALNNLPAARPVYIMVAPGAYNENVHITQSDVKIIGSGPFASMIDGLVVSQDNPLGLTPQGAAGITSGPTFFIGAGGMSGSVSNVMISGFTITGGTPGSAGPGAGIFGDYGNVNIDINNNIIARNGGAYGGGIWLHKSNHDVRIWSNLIAENGNMGGYGGGISVNDEPEYGPPAPVLDHTYDDALYSTPPGTYAIYNNLIFHNYSPDYGGGISLYEAKDQLNVYGNVILENRSDDHGGGIFFEDSGPVDLYDNVFLRNFATDDGGAISFEDVGDNISKVRVYNNLIAENIADDRGENSARGGGIAFEDTHQAEVFNNTITGNIVAGSFDPTGGAIDSERHGHEYDAASASPKPPYFSDVKVYNNIIWNNYRLFYDTNAFGEDLDYRYGTNYQWSVNNIHVDNPAINQPWETDLNSESLSLVENNDIEGGAYGARTGNINIDPAFTDPALMDWHLLASSPVIGVANASTAPTFDLDLIDRTIDGAADMGALEYRVSPLNVIRIPTDVIGNVEMPVPYSTQLHPPATTTTVP